jgi:hypothetical protein
MAWDAYTEGNGVRQCKRQERAKGDGGRFFLRFAPDRYCPRRTLLSIEKTHRRILALVNNEQTRSTPPPSVRRHGVSRRRSTYL